MQTDSGLSSPTWRGRRPSSFVFPLLMVVVGAVLLLNNLGWLPWSVWSALGQLWPVILILFGFDLVVGRRNAWLGASITTIALVAVLGAAVWLTYSGREIGPQYASAAPVPAKQSEGAVPVPAKQSEGAVPVPAKQSESAVPVPAKQSESAVPVPAKQSESAVPVPVNQHAVSVPLAGATSGSVSLEFGAGVLNVSALPDSATDLVQATATLPPGMSLNQEASPTSDVATVALSTQGRSGLWPFRGFDQNGRGPTMDAQLTSNVPLTLQADIGAGQSTFDLTNLLVRELSLNSGAGQTTVRLPVHAGNSTIDIHSGAGQVILEVPTNVGVYLHTSNGIVNVRVPADRFDKVSDGYQTSGYSTAANRVDVNLHVGIGEVDVQ